MTTCLSTLNLFSDANEHAPAAAGAHAATGPNPAARAQLARQLTPVFSVRLVRERSIDAGQYGSPVDAARLFCRYLDGCDREHFAVALLTVQHQLIGLHTAHVGDLTSCIASPRDVFKVALLANAASIIVAHNHPSGGLEPSSADVHVTRQLHQAGRLMDVPLLDSLVIGFGGAYTSLAERGLLS